MSKLLDMLSGLWALAMDNKKTVLVAATALLVGAVLALRACDAEEEQVSSAATQSSSTFVSTEDISANTQTVEANVTVESESETNEENIEATK